MQQESRLGSPGAGLVAAHAAPEAAVAASGMEW